jgi:hypothetical protein
MTGDSDTRNPAPRDFTDPPALASTHSVRQKIPPDDTMSNQILPPAAPPAPGVCFPPQFFIKTPPACHWTGPQKPWVSGDILWNHQAENSSRFLQTAPLPHNSPRSTSPRIAPGSQPSKALRFLNASPGIIPSGLGARERKSPGNRPADRSATDDAQGHPQDAQGLDDLTADPLHRSLPQLLPKLLNGPWGQVKVWGSL